MMMIQMMMHKINTFPLSESMIIIFFFFLPDFYYYYFFIKTSYLIYTHITHIRMRTSILLFAILVIILIAAHTTVNGKDTPEIFPGLAPVRFNNIKETTPPVPPTNPSKQPPMCSKLEDKRMTNLIFFKCLGEHYHVDFLPLWMPKHVVECYAKVLEAGYYLDETIISKYSSSKDPWKNQ